MSFIFVSAYSQVMERSVGGELLNTAKTCTNVPTLRLTQLAEVQESIPLVGFQPSNVFIKDHLGLVGNLHYSNSASLIS